jgi:hypothetical protein
MKKRLLLLAAVLTASANITFADDEPVVHVKTVQDSNGNTFTYHDENDKDESSDDGTTTDPAPASYDFNPTLYTLTVNSDLKSDIKDCDIIYNVKLSALSANPGTIASFKQRLQDDYTSKNLTVYDSQIVIEDEDGCTYTIIDENGEYFLTYLSACERVNIINPNNKKIYRGNQLTSNSISEDKDGYAINEKLYYIKDGKGTSAKYIPILNTAGTYATGTTYSNSFVTYNPVGIADGFQSYEVEGDGKVGSVSGVVDDDKVKEILNNTTYPYLNFDFTNASVLGTLSYDIDDNKVAYFNNGVAVENGKGQNIVVGNTCNSYVISDNGKEIYVNKAFQAAGSQYKRRFTPETYGTIVLPFPVDNTGNVFVKKAELTAYEPSENKLTFTTAQTMAPNTPYLFKVHSTVTGESTLSGPVNGTVYATAEAKSAKFNGAQFVGTFEGLTAQEASDVYVVGEVGKIGRTAKALKPGRCYLTREDPPSNSRFVDAIIEIIDEDGSIETIDVDENDEKVTAIDGVVNGKVVSVQYISLNGQISSEPFSGINLVKKTFEDGSVETSKAIF